MDPFSEGILFSVMPPKKSWKHISNLSGGEKTLSSLALVFALHAFAPTPLYVLDEVDAALDFKNVSVISSIVASRSSSGANPAQFVVISHRNDMFERSQRLCGVWKTSGRSRSLAIDNSDMHAPPLPPPGSVASTPGMRRSAVPGSAMSSKMVDMRGAGRASTATLVPATPLSMRQRQITG
jgi:structural maintenance of chromosome 4